MDLLFDLVDLPALTVAAREIDPPTTYGVLDALLPRRVIDAVRYKIRRGTLTRGVAQYRTYDAPTPMGKRTGTSQDTEVKLYPLGQMLMVGEYESLELARMNGQNDGALIQQVYDDTRSNVEAINKRLHLGVGELLSTGAFSWQHENGLYDVAEYEVPAGNLNQVPDDLFSDETADILGFLADLADLYETNSDDGQRPGQFTTSRKVVANMRRNIQLTRVTKGPLVTEAMPLTLADINAAMDANGLPPIVIDESKVDGQRVFDERLIIATPADPNDLGHTVLGMTGQGLLLLNSNSVDLAREDAPGIIVTTWTQNNPPAIFSSADANGMPVLGRPDLLATAVVLA